MDPHIQGEHTLHISLLPPFENLRPALRRSASICDSTPRAGGLRRQVSINSEQPIRRQVSISSSTPDILQQPFLSEATSPEDGEECPLSPTVSVTSRRSLRGDSESMWQNDGNDCHATATVVSVTESQLQHVFQYLTHYFVLMYCVDTGGQAFTLVVEVVFKVFELDTEYTCFLHMMMMLDFVFIVLLTLDVGLSVYLMGLDKFLTKAQNVFLMVLLVLSIGGLVLQAMDMEHDSSTLYIELLKNALRTTRVVVFWRKLQYVLNSPICHWDVHGDILKQHMPGPA